MGFSFLHLYRVLFSTLLFLLLGSTLTLAADRMERLPAELKGVGLTEKTSSPVALEQSFLDENGKRVRLEDLIVGGKPVILSFNYSNCPLLCSVQIDGLVDTMRDMEWSVGSEFEIITISLDPKESTERANETKSRYLSKYRREGAKSGWHFLTGDAKSIQAVADSVGFGYRYHVKRKEYLHPAVLTLVSPLGNVSGYLPGVTFDPVDVRDKLIIAQSNEISPALTELILSCYHYNARTRNGAIVQKIMTYGGLVFVLGFVGALAVFRTKHSRKVNAHKLGSTGDHV